MPAPMMQPMPSETRLHAESVRFNGTPPWATKACNSISSASAWSRAIGFLIRIFGTLSPSPSGSCLRRMVQLSAANNQAATRAKRKAPREATLQTVTVQKVTNWIGAAGNFSTLAIGRTSSC